MGMRVTNLNDAALCVLCRLGRHGCLDDVALFPAAHVNILTVAPSGVSQRPHWLQAGIIYGWTYRHKPSAESPLQPTIGTM